MSDKQSINFSAAHARLRKAADETLEWFAVACGVHRESNDGSKLLMHALMDGLRRAYEAGRAGAPPPVPNDLQLIARFKKGEWREDTEAPKVQRRSRVAPVVVEAPVVRPRPARRPAQE